MYSGPYPAHIGHIGNEVLTSRLTVDKDLNLQIYQQEALRLSLFKNCSRSMSHPAGVITETRWTILRRKDNS